MQLLQGYGIVAFLGQGHGVVIVKRRIVSNLFERSSQKYLRGAGGESLS